MQMNFWENSKMDDKVSFPGTREAALARLEEFEKTASRYGRDRNHVVPGHTNVSRLSPAIRHRLITETEVAKYIQHRYAFSTVEKFLQEVYWRRYWKGWLALRPQIWTEYLKDLSVLEPCETALKIMRGEGEVAVMNDFARELVETGYLHNHARMWFAGYWVHRMKLPWQLGADFFYRHLLDADPASNTLSWRWVAGLQTQGKTYLARRTNIEKYLHPDLLEGREEGLEQLSNYQAVVTSEFVRPEVQPYHPPHSFKPSSFSGFWIHSDDLSVLPECEEVFLSDESQTSEIKSQWMKTALDDVESRLNHCEVQRGPIKDLVVWAEKKKLTQVITYRPEIGELHDQLEGIEQDLKNANIELVFKTREEDVELQGFAKAGFFGFWKKIESRVRALK